jgi:flagellar biosynthesis/type III secretory pathway protein FliH
MTMAEKWLQEGRQQGLEQGMQQGLEQGMQQGLEQGMQQGQQQGQRVLLVELLQTKFGSVNEQVLRRVDAADEFSLKRYAQRILTAATLDEVFVDQE